MDNKEQSSIVEMPPLNESFADIKARADMAEKLAELLANAVAMVDRDVIRVRPSERALLINALSEWNTALSEWDALKGEK